MLNPGEVWRGSGKPVWLVRAPACSLTRNLLDIFCTSKLLFMAEVWVTKYYQAFECPCERSCNSDLAMTIHDSVSTQLVNKYLIHGQFKVCKMVYWAQIETYLDRQVWICPLIRATGLSAAKHVDCYKTWRPRIPQVSIFFRIKLSNSHWFRFSRKYEFKKPNDRRAIDLMNASAAAVMKELPDIIIAYGISDEFSFVLHRSCTLFERRER